MKFLCPSCKAKYQIADEKIAARTLKMECRRCNHQITIRGDADVEAMDAAASPSARPASRVAPGAGSPRPAGAARGSSSVGPSPARGGAAQGSQRSALGADFRRNSVEPPPSRPAPVEQWHVAINDVPVGPMRRDEIARKVAMGAITGDSLSWREGFDDWRPVRDVPELAALLRRATPEPRGGGHLPAPRGAAPGARSISPARGGPGAPRPAADIRASARGSVVPIGGRLGAAAAPAIDEDEDLAQEEATTIASAADLGLAGFGPDPLDERLAPAKPEPAKAKALPAPRAALAQKAPAAPAARAAPAAKPAPAPAPAPAPTPKAAPAPEGRVSSPGEINFDAPVFVAPAPVEPAVFAAPMAAPMAAVAMRQSAPPPARRGLPVGAWMGIAGVMTFAAVFALIAAQRVFPAAPVPVPAPAVAAALPITAPIEIPDPVPVPVAAVEDPTPAVAEVAPVPTAPAAHTAPSGTPRHAATSSSSGGSSGGAAARPGSSGGADLSRFADEGTGSSGPTGLAARPSGGSSGGSGGGSAAEELTVDQIRTVVNRERTGLTRCWETAIRGMRETPTVRLEVEITIGSSGTVTNATASGPTVGTLTECMERNVRHWRFPASGGTSRTTFPVVFTGTS